MKMESDQSNGNWVTNGTDSDIEDIEEINFVFPACHRLYNQSLGPKYILDIASNRETNPYIATTLSDYSINVFTLTNNGLSKVAQFTEHTNRVVKCKFSPLNNNLFYSGSNDGTIKLWDLRDPSKSAVTFSDTTVEDSASSKSVNTFDISPCDRLLAAGTDLTGGDAFILFWDVRNLNLLGAYWESHTDDITEVQFRPDDSNVLMSGSTDGLINTYNLLETSEDDALQECLNTEALVESLLWFKDHGRWKISCVTSINDLQLWETDGAEPYKRLHRSGINAAMKLPTNSAYISKVHSFKDSLFILCGSNMHEGKSLRSLMVSNEKVRTAFQFKENEQRVRASCVTQQENILLTGGEKGKLDVWKLDLSLIDYKI